MLEFAIDICKVVVATKRHGIAGCHKPGGVRRTVGLGPIFPTLAELKDPILQLLQLVLGKSNSTNSEGSFGFILIHNASFIVPLIPD